MDLREYRLNVAIIIAIMVAVLFIIGGITVFTISLGGTGSGGSNSTTLTPVNPPKSLPQGYSKSNISIQTAQDTHIQAISGQSYNFTHRRSTKNDSRVTVWLKNASVSQHGRVRGTVQVETTNEKRVTEFFSPNNVLYFKHTEDGQVKEFGNPQYVTGSQLFRKVVSNASVALTDYTEKEQITLFYYQFRERTGNSRGGITIDENGMIRRIWMVDSDSTRGIEEVTMTIQPTENQSIDTPEWVVD